MELINFHSPRPHTHTHWKSRWANQISHCCNDTILFKHFQFKTNVFYSNSNWEKRKFQFLFENIQHTESVKQLMYSINKHRKSGEWQNHRATRIQKKRKEKLIPFSYISVPEIEKLGNLSIICNKYDECFSDSIKMKIFTWIPFNSNCCNRDPIPMLSKYFRSYSVFNSHLFNIQDSGFSNPYSVV